MDDYYDDGDFGDDGDFFEDSDGDFGSEDLPDDDSAIENEPTGDDICDDEFTVEDAVMAGVAFGWGYEEGAGERRRRKLEKKMNADRDKRNNHSGT